MKLSLKLGTGTRASALTFISLLLIFLLGSWLRVSGLNEFYFWGDETFHINLIPKLDEGFFPSARYNWHPPLFVLFLKYVILLLGIEKPIYFRMVSLVAGILTIGLGYLWTKQITRNSPVALFTAYLIATSPMLIEQSQLVRGYSLFLCFIFLYLWLCSFNSLKGLSYVICLVTTCLAAATHYSFLLLQPGLFILALPKVSAHTRWGVIIRRVGLIVTHIVCAIVSIYFIKQFPKGGPDAFVQGLTSNFVGGHLFVSVWSAIEHLWKMFFGTQLLGTPLFTVLFFALGLLLLFRSKKYVFLAFSISPYLIGILAAITKSYPLTGGRHCIYLFLPTLFAMIICMDSLFKRKPFALVGVFLIICYYQLRNPMTIFNPNNNRWSFGEGSYSFKDLSPLSTAIRLKVFLDRPIIVDERDGHSIQMEKIFSPSWSLFESSIQDYFFCGYLDIEDNQKLCTCLSKAIESKKTRKFYILYSKWGPRLPKPLKSTECFQTTRMFKLSDYFIVSEVDAKAPSQIVGIVN